MKGQRIHDSVFLKFNSDECTPRARLPRFYYWIKEDLERTKMLEIGASIVSAQKYISDLRQVTQETVATLDDVLQAVEKFMSTGKLLQYITLCHIVSII